MSLGRTYPLNLTHEEILLLAYNLCGPDKLAAVGVDHRIAQSSAVWNSLQAKVMQAVPKDRAAKVDRDRLWQAINDASKG